MKHKIIVIFVLALMFSLAGCGNTNKLAEYDMTGISFISYADIDTVCEDEELTTAGKRKSRRQWIHGQTCAHC